MRIRRPSAALAAASLLLALAAATPAASAAAGDSVRCGWQLVDVPHPGDGSDQGGVVLDQVQGLSVVDSHDVWFLGNLAVPPSGGRGFDFELLHWDGKRVTVVGHPRLSPSEHGNILFPAGNSISFDAAGDGWVLGFYSPLTGQYTHKLSQEQVAAHWDGTRWDFVPVATDPEEAQFPLWLQSVHAIAPDDAWAVGNTGLSGRGQSRGSVIEHWDGTRWTMVPGPTDRAAGAELHDLAAAAPNDVWAVGTVWIDGGTRSAPAIEHWDGTGWTLVPSPAIDTDAVLNGVTVNSATDAWAVGATQSPAGIHTLVEHWDGTAWSIVPGAADSPADSALNGVHAFSRTDAWAVGSTPGSGQIQHWDGRAWTRSSLPGPQEWGRPAIYARVDGASPDDVWAVGETFDRFSLGTGNLLAHYTCHPDNRPPGR